METPESKKDLLHKEIDINLQKQLLLKKKIQETKNLLQALGKDDPQVAIYQTQVEMNLIEIDELEQQQMRLKKELLEP